MALQDILDRNVRRTRNKIGFSEERINAIIPIARQYIAYWRQYPDMFIDFLQDGGDKTRKRTLNFYFYQRVFLRVGMRYKYVYAVFPRAYSKSFLSVLLLVCRAILYPGSKQFTTAGGKQQAAGILKEKIDEICSLVPAINKEFDNRRGVKKESRDYVYYKFKNGSFIDNLAANEKTRGKRRQGGVLEECVTIDGKILSEVLIPVMNVSRMCADGTTQQDEPLNQSQLYITTAGYKGTFPYQKLIQVLVQMITEPNKAFILGGTYRIPVAAGLISKSFVSDLKKDGTFNEASFAREYESQWTGTVEDAFFNGEKFDRNRILLQPELQASGRSAKNSYYVIAADIGRSKTGCPSVACVFKVSPQATGRSIKSLVNIFEYEGEHFEDQAIALKTLFYKYKARKLVIDGNGVGWGLLDFMVKSQVLPDGTVLPDFGVENDIQGEFKKFKTNNTEFEAMYVIKANAPINTEIYSTVQTQVESGAVKFLIDERVAKNKLLGTKVGQNMKPEQRSTYLRPFTATSGLREEMLNLRQTNEGVNIILKQANNNIKKDKFSAFAYGLYYIKQEEDSKKRKKKFNAKDWLFLN